MPNKDEASPRDGGPTSSSGPRSPPSNPKSHGTSGTAREKQDASDLPITRAVEAALGEGEAKKAGKHGVRPGSPGKTLFIGGSFPFFSMASFLM